MSEQKRYYESGDEIRSVVEGFESCELPPSGFDHRAHLTVAASYVSMMTEEEAIERMRASLLRFITHHGVGPRKYNETITRFWIKRVRKALDETEADGPFAARVNEAIERAGNARLVFDYYSSEHVFSEEARRDWVEPDLKPLDF